MLLIDKVRYIKNFKSLFEQKSIPIRQVPNSKWLGALHRWEPRERFI